MSQTIVGIFDDPSEAQEAVQQLLIDGFSRADIDLSLPESVQGGDKFSNFFSSLFGANVGKSYAEVARQSGAIVTVHVDTQDEAIRATEILDEAGALDMDERAIEYGVEPPGYQAETTEFQPGTPEYQAGAAAFQPGSPEYEAGIAGQERHGAEAAREETVIPVIEEQLKVGKREVETGRARLRSRIIERPVEEHLRLREEHVHVERHAVNRPATEADMESFRDSEIELTEHAEVPLVTKEARVVEEVEFGKDIEEHDEIVKDKIRKTQIDVEEKRP
ncbi:YsnF/AvaK domain-containing protein [Methylobacter sp. BBA5.1]|jgi:stress response protein YsnF|uniref:YsnF/AvaK domain-containing protein n=1 Tax=Methylobacter sp. BBA5.1 TaxID=1495064 RepID=UPI00055AD1C3|nr:YsnF/AvaK domain-containing protein [Methylobacter sp. BBA5.1]